MAFLASENGETWKILTERRKILTESRKILTYSVNVSDREFSTD